MQSLRRVDNVDLFNPDLKQLIGGRFMNFALGAVWLALTTALLVTLGSTSAHAEDCSQYRAHCVAAQNPKFAAR
jgi:hypothetical protein